MPPVDLSQVPAEIRVAKALSHPLRARILEAFATRVASPSELAEVLGEPLGNVGYHTRVLLEHRCIEPVRIEQRRGAKEHFYRAVVRPQLDEAQWRRVPPAIRREIMGRTLAEVWSGVSEAADTGRLDRPDTHVSKTRLNLDAQGWHELNEVLEGTLNEAHRIQAESAQRATRSGREGDHVPSELAILHFERCGARRARPGGDDPTESGRKIRP